MFKAFKKCFKKKKPLAFGMLRSERRKMKDWWKNQFINFNEIETMEKIGWDELKYV